MTPGQDVHRYQPAREFVDKIDRALEHEYNAEPSKERALALAEVCLETAARVIARAWKLGFRGKFGILLCEIGLFLWGQDARLGGKDGL